MLRRYAAHYIEVPGQGFLKNRVIEVEDGRMVRVFPLQGEPAGTEWLPGVIRVEEERQVFHYYPFNFDGLQPVAGTRRRQLR